MTKKNFILITGGHVTPAIALIEELKMRGYNDILFVGRKFSMEGDKADSYEFQEISKRGITFVPLITGRFTRHISPITFFSWIKIPVGLIQSIFIILRYRPCITISFGGYIAFPISLTSFLLGIPIVTHEQTRKIGLANRVIAMFARKVCVSWELGSFSKEDGKTIITGNPLRKELIEEPGVSPLGHNVSRPIIFICGGSLGSHAINKSVGEILSEITKRYEIVHQSGSSQLTFDYEHLVKARENLPFGQAQHYHVFRYLDAKNVSWLYHNATLVVSRAGANTVAELAFFGTPSILVPLPWSGGGEQQVNADFLAATGIAEVLSQEDLHARLLNTIDSMVKHVHEYRSHGSEARKLVKSHASALLADVVEEIAFKI